MKANKCLYSLFYRKLKHLLAFVFLCTFVSNQSLKAQSYKFDQHFVVQENRASEYPPYQLLDLHIPSVYFQNSSVFLSIYDADISGENDAVFGQYDTWVAYSLLKSSVANVNDINSTDSYTSIKMGWNKAADQRAILLRKLDPDVAVKDEGDYLSFLLLVQVLEGDDANRFSLRLSKDPRASDLIMDDAYITTEVIQTASVESHLLSTTGQNPREHNLKSLVNYSVRATIEDCSTFSFQLNAKDASFQILKSNWVFESDMFSVPKGKVRLDAYGYHNYEVKVQGLYNGKEVEFSIKDSTYVNQRPVANAGADRFIGIGENISFDGTISEDYDGSIQDYIWDLGDGTTLEGARIDHIYQNSGSYKVVLTVFDNASSPCNMAQDTILVKVNAPPVIRYSGPEFIESGQEYYVDASKSFDPDGSIQQIIWLAGNQILSKKAKDRIRIPIDYKGALELRVVDDSYTTNEKSSFWVMQKGTQPPQAKAGKNKTSIPGQGVIFDASNSTAPQKITKYEWLIDGEVRSGKTVKHSFDKSGRYEAVLTVTDSRGYTASDTIAVFVNHKPNASMQIEKIEGLSISLDGRASTDRDGGELLYEWDFGDGTRERASQITHTYKEAGKYTIKLLVRDNSGAPNAWASVSQNIAIGDIQVSNTTENDFTDASIEPEIKIENTVINNLFLGAKKPISGPDVVEVGQTILLEVDDANIDKNARFFWDLGSGIEPGIFKINTSFEKSGTYQVMAVMVSDTDEGLVQTYFHKEIKVKAPLSNRENNRKKIDQNARTISGAKVYVYLISDQSLSNAAHSKTNDLIANISLTNVSKKGAANWYASNFVCPDSKYDLYDFIGVAKNPIIQKQFEYYWNGLLISRGELESKVFDLSQLKRVKMHIVNQVTTQDYEIQWSPDIDKEAIVNATVPAEANAKEWILFSASNSYDPNGNNLNYYWDFGNGERRIGKSVMFRYDLLGRYKVSLRVTSANPDQSCNELTKEWMIVVH